MGRVSVSACAHVLVWIVEELLCGSRGDGARVLHLVHARLREERVHIQILYGTLSPKESLVGPVLETQVLEPPRPTAPARGAVQTGGSSGRCCYIAELHSNAA